MTRTAEGEAQTRRDQLPMGERKAPIETQSLNAKARTFDVCWSTGSRVRRYNWQRDQFFHEELSLDAKHVRLGVLNNGAPFLDSHRQWSLEGVIGVVERAWLANGEGHATIRIEGPGNEVVDRIWKRIEEGLLRFVSVGYVINKLERTGEFINGSEPVMRAVDWEPREISLVAVPADTSAGIRSERGEEYPCEITTRADAHNEEETAVKNERSKPGAAPETPTAGTAAETRSADDQNKAANPDDTSQAAPGASETRSEPSGERRSPTDAGNTSPASTDGDVGDAVQRALKTERERVDEIRRVGESLGLREEAHRLINDGTSIDAARKAMLDKWAEDGRAAESVRGGTGSGIRMGADASDKFAEGVAAGLMARSGFTKDEGAERNEFTGLTLRELARKSLEMAGVRAAADPMEMVGQAFTRAGEHSSSDFPSILANVAKKSMLKGYEEAEESFRKFTSTGVLTDFKPTSRVDLNLFPSLAEVPEGAEYKYATLGDRGEQIKLATYGRLFSITRQAVINDDLDMIGKIPRRMGRAAIRTIGNLVFAELTENPQMSDGNALFSAAHANLRDPGDVPSIAEISALKTLMTTQHDPDGHATALNIRPAYMLVPVALEDSAAVLMASEFDPSKTQRVPNPHRSTMEVISDARLDAASAKEWYLAANPNIHDTIEVSYLNGVQEPTIERQDGWKVDGVEFKVRIDAGVKALDYRGLAKDEGEGAG